ncbi:MAG: hypothetical protein AABP62_31150 [Planctomycetota bacterium]
MTIKVKCVACGKGLNVADGAAGKRVKCPGCGESVRVPGDSARAAVASDEFDLGGISSFDESEGEPLPSKSKPTRKTQPKRKRLELTDGDVRLLVTFRRVAAWMGGFCMLLGVLVLLAFSSLSAGQRQYADPEIAASFRRYALGIGTVVAILGGTTCLKQGWALVLLALLGTYMTYCSLVLQRFGYAGVWGVFATIGWIGAVPAIMLYLRWIPTTTKLRG